MNDQGFFPKSRRCVKPEAIFVLDKALFDIESILIKRLEKVNTEFKVVAIAYNLIKLAKKASYFCCLLTS